MKRTSWIIASISIAAVLISTATNKTYAVQDSGIGEYVDVAPLKGEGWNTPPGHYGLMALYANRFLSNGPANGSYVVTWSFVKPNISQYFVLDVRATGFCAGHIAGAVNIPYATVVQPYNLDRLPTDQPILVVCASGAQSGQVGALLGMMGYQVRILAGGMATVPAADRVNCP